MELRALLLGVALLLCAALARAHVGGVVESPVGSLFDRLRGAFVRHRPEGIGARTWRPRDQAAFASISESAALSASLSSAHAASSSSSGAERDVSGSATVASSSSSSSAAATEQDQVVVKLYQPHLHLIPPPRVSSTSTSRSTPPPASPHPRMRFRASHTNSHQHTNSHAHTHAHKRGEVDGDEGEVVASHLHMTVDNDPRLKPDYYHHCGCEPQPCSCVQVCKKRARCSIAAECKSPTVGPVGAVNCTVKSGKIAGGSCAYANQTQIDPTLLCRVKSYCVAPDGYQFHNIFCNLMTSDYSHALIQEQCVRTDGLFSKLPDGSWCFPEPCHSSLCGADAGAKSRFQSSRQRAHAQYDPFTNPNPHAEYILEQGPKGNPFQVDTSYGGFNPFNPLASLLPPLHAKKPDSMTRNRDLDKHAWMSHALPDSGPRGVSPFAAPPYTVGMMARNYVRNPTGR